MTQWNDRTRFQQWFDHRVLRSAQNESACKDGEGKQNNIHLHHKKDNIFTILEFDSRIVNLYYDSTKINQRISGLI